MRLSLRSATRLHRATGFLVGTIAIVLTAVGTFVGCRGQYGGVDGGGGSTPDFLSTGRTLSFFRAIQVDPRSEDSAGPQFVVAEDLNSDGLLDLVSAWNESQPVQIHLQRRSGGAIQFETTILAGNIPVVSVAGLAVTDFDGDNAPDIAVLLKNTLSGDAACLDSELPAGAEQSGLMLLYLGPADATQTNQALAWREAPVEASRLAGRGGAAGVPEEGGYTSMAVGDLDRDGDMDIVVAWNSNCGGESGSRDAVVFFNQGFGAVRDGTWVATPVPNSAPVGTAIKDVALGDIDADGDLDIVATFPDAGSMNVRWFRNPVVDVADDFHISDGQWQVGTIGQIATQADIIRIGDLDGDGLLDVLVRSTAGKVIQWLKGAGGQSTTAPLANIPWRVYTLAEFSERTPQSLAIGDLNFDRQVEVIVSAGGGVLWLDAESAPSVYDQWIERLIVDDDPPGRPDQSPATTDPNVSPDEVAGVTSINSILVVDLDGDGANDLVATLDRVGLSGLSNDALVWFRNTQTAPN